MKSFSVHTSGLVCLIMILSLFLPASSQQFISNEQVYWRGTCLIWSTSSATLYRRVCAARLWCKLTYRDSYYQESWMNYALFGDRYTCEPCEAWQYCPGGISLPDYPYCPIDKPYCAEGFDAPFCSSKGAYYYSITSLQSECIQCTPGNYVQATNCYYPGTQYASPYDANRYLCTQICTQCQIDSTGAFQYYCPNGRDMQTCVAGTFTAQGASYCTTCGLGRRMISSTAVNVSCVNCTAGTYWDSLDYSATVCKTCDIGKVARMTGQSSCTTCGQGSYASSASSCSSCFPGTYLDDGSVASTLCNTCAPGKVALVSGQSSCATCGPGMYASSASSCSSCSPGTYWDNATLETTSCSTCAVGKVALNSSQSTCFSCGLGRFMLSASSCSTCSYGTYWDNANISATSCQVCQQGKVALNLGQSTCSICGVGTYTSSSSSCTLCSPGTYWGNATVSAASCQACSTGYVALNSGQSTCTTCGVGMYAASSSKCSYCPPGTSWLYPSTANTACEACNPNTCETSYPFTSSQSTLMLARDTYLDIFMIGGGGGGGMALSTTGSGGGGGAGAYLYIKGILLPAGTYSVSVGAGGGPGQSGFPTNITRSGFSSSVPLLSVAGGACGGTNGAGCSSPGGCGGGQ